MTSRLPWRLRAWYWLVELVRGDPEVDPDFELMQRWGKKRFPG